MHKKHLALGSMVVAGAMILSGCASGSTDTSKSTGVNKNVDGKGKTLTLWHYESDTSAMGIAWNQAIKTFVKETGAKVKFEPKRLGLDLRSHRDHGAA
jgi:raffinose/stachyose/melibiose transport system substrate-binding protein